MTDNRRDRNENKGHERDTDRKVSLVVGDICQIYDQLQSKNRLTNLTLKMFFSTTSIPVLHAKAAETSALLYVIRDLFGGWRRVGNTHDDVLMSTLNSMCDAGLIVRTGGDFLSDLEFWNRSTSFNNLKQLKISFRWKP